MIIAIITLIVLILINAFFAASELAFVNLKDNKIQRMAESGDKKAKKLYSLISTPSHFLSTIQIGITLAGFLSSAFAADFFAGPLAQWLFDIGAPLSLNMLNTISVILITIVLTYFTLVFGELVPKQLAIQKPESISNVAVGPITIMAKMCLPIVKFLTFSINTVLRLFGVDPNAQNEDATEEDIRMMVDIGGERGTINPSEKLMIDNVFEFNDKVASDIITHRTDMSALSVEMGIPDILQQINTYRYTRFPVYEDDIDNIVGVLHVKDLFPFITQNGNGAVNFKSVIRKPYFVMENQSIDVLFSEMRNENIHIAIVLDEFGGTEGIITLEDVIEEIVGEISSESLEHGFQQEEIKEIAPNQYIVKGTFRLWELSEILKMELPTDEFDTVNGFLISKIGYIPSKEESPIIDYQHIIFEGKKIGDNRIEEVLVTIKDKNLS